MLIDLKYERCESCKYFLQHYIKKSSFYSQACCGHCTNGKLNGSSVRNKYALHQNCEYWEHNEIKKTERRESINAVLANMAERLGEIVSILKEDD